MGCGLAKQAFFTDILPTEAMVCNHFSFRHKYIHCVKITNHFNIKARGDICFQRNEEF